MKDRVACWLLGRVVHGQEFYDTLIVGNRKFTATEMVVGLSAAVERSRTDLDLERGIEGRECFLEVPVLEGSDSCLVESFCFGVRGKFDALLDRG